MTCNIKVMEWVSSILREASKTNGNTIKRWRKKYAFLGIYYAKNFNGFRKYISLINVRGRRRPVIVIPELTLNSHQTKIAEKIERFINSQQHLGNLATNRLVDENIPYANMLKNFKWANKGKNNVPAGDIIKKSGRICIIEGAYSPHKKIKHCNYHPS